MPYTNSIIPMIKPAARNVAKGVNIRDIPNIVMITPKMIDKIAISFPPFLGFLYCHPYFIIVLFLTLKKR
jgi:hypothetical protein